MGSGIMGTIAVVCFNSSNSSGFAIYLLLNSSFFILLIFHWLLMVSSLHKAWPQWLLILFQISGNLHFAWEGGIAKVSFALVVLIFWCHFLLCDPKLLWYGCTDLKGWSPWAKLHSNNWLKSQLVVNIVDKNLLSYPSHTIYFTHNE